MAWLGLAGGLHAVHTGETLPGTRVVGVELGGLSPEQARSRLASATQGRTVTLAYKKRRFPLAAQDVGFDVDVDATVGRAMNAGRRGPLGGLLWADITSLWTEREVAPANTVDRDRLSSAIAAIADKVGRPAFYGDLSVDPDSLRVRVKPPRPALKVNRQATAETVLARLRGTGGGPAPARMPVRAGPVPPTEDIRAVADAARAYLKAPLRLTSEPGRSGQPEVAVKITPKQLAPVLTVAAVDAPTGNPIAAQEPPEVELGVRKKKLSELVDTLAGEVNRKRVPTEISAPARPGLVDKQQSLTWSPRPADAQVDPGQTGRKLRPDATAEAVTSAIREGRHTAKLPLRRLPVGVPARPARKVEALIGTFTTYFQCCKPRVTNIQRMAEAVDGTVIMPGKEFSLNGVAGERTRAKGYVPAPFILRGELVPSVGGGVSQFSTTTYNAAFFAGLPITDHQPHSYYISRYPPGREATLNYPNIDLTWVNDTDAPILVRSAATDNSVTVSLYGANTGRTVRGITGSRRPLQQGDFKITITRKITYPDGRVERHSNTVRYDKPPDATDGDGGSNQDAR